MEDEETVLAKTQKKEVNYFTSDMAKINATCYLEDDGVTRIIGTIVFADDTIGYLTDNNYSDEGSYDSYEGDRIILIQKENDIETERGDKVFASDTDFENYKKNCVMDRIIKSINTHKKYIDSATKAIELCNSIINHKEPLTFEQMLKMRKGE